MGQWHETLKEKIKHMQASMKSLLRKENIARNCAVVLGAVMVTFLCAEGVNSWVYSKAKTETVTFATYGAENGIPLRIVDNLLYKADDERLINDHVAHISTEEEMALLIDNKNSDAAQDEKSEFVWAQRKQYIYDSLLMQQTMLDQTGFLMRRQSFDARESVVFEAKTADATVRFQLPIYPSTCVSIEKNGTDLSLAIFRNSNPSGDWIDAGLFKTTENEYSQKVYFYDFSDYAYLLIYYALAYAIIFTVAIFVLGAMICLGKTYTNRLTFLSGYHAARMFLLVFTGVAVWLCVTYAMNPHQFRIGVGADAYYYAYADRQAEFLTENGDFSLQLFFANSWPHRSYLPISIYYGLNAIAKVLLFDERYLHLILNAFFLSIAAAVATPMLHKAVSGKTVRDWQILLFTGLYIIFWRAHLFYQLTDLPGASLALLAMAAGILLVQQQKTKYAFLFGLSGALAIAYRASYTIMFELGMVAIGISLIVKLIKKKNIPLKKRILQLISGIVLPLVVLVAVLLPQGYINLQKGHIGLMPYANSGTYNAGKNDLGKPQWGSLAGYKFAATTYQDEQMNSVTDSFITDDVLLAQSDVPFIILSSPIPLIMAMLKRLFYSVSAYQEPIYHYLVYGRNEAMVTVQYLLNYFLIGNVLYYSFVRKTKGLSLGIKLLFCFTLVFQVLAQVGLFHIERRFFLLFFMLIYLINACCIPRCFAEDLGWPDEQDRIRRQCKYLGFIFCFMVCCYTAICTINFNFI